MNRIPSGHSRSSSSRSLAGRRLARLITGTLCAARELRRARLEVRPGSEEWVRLSATYLHLWTQWVCEVFGIRVRVEGPVPPDGSFLAPNHQGYVDVLALGSAIPTLFIAKSDVERWPVVGRLLRFSSTLFVSRATSREIRGVIADASDRLKSGLRVAAFLEGTSTGGEQVLEFKPSLLQAAAEADAPAVPVAIVWKVGDQGRSVPEDVAYWKDHTFVPHFLKFAGLRLLSVRVRFGDPVPVRGRNRRAVADELRSGVERLMSEIRTGETPERVSTKDQPNCESNGGETQGSPAGRKGGEESGVPRRKRSRILAPAA